LIVAAAHTSIVLISHAFIARPVIATADAIPNRSQPHQHQRTAHRPTNTTVPSNNFFAHVVNCWQFFVVVSLLLSLSLHPLHRHLSTRYTYSYQEKIFFG
jgi:hypothetical protein